MSPVSSLQAAIGVLVADLAAVAVGFGVLNSTIAGVVVTAVVGAVSVAFIVANELHRSTAVKAAAAKVAQK